MDAVRNLGAGGCDGSGGHVGEQAMRDVELLRTASAAMRERAQAATPGAWFDDRHVTGDGSVVMGPMLRVAHLPKSEATSNDAANAEHIASWHPAVALAVADWLDAEVWRVKRSESAITFDGQPMFPPSSEALKLARAYLGQDAQHAPEAQQRASEDLGGSE